MANGGARRRSPCRNFSRSPRRGGVTGRAACSAGRSSPAQRRTPPTTRSPRLEADGRFEPARHAKRRWAAPARGELEGSRAPRQHRARELSRLRGDVRARRDTAEARRRERRIFTRLGGGRARWRRRCRRVRSRFVRRPCVRSVRRRPQAGRRLLRRQRSAGARRGGVEGSRRLRRDARRRLVADGVLGLPAVRAGRAGGASRSRRSISVARAPIRCSRSRSSSPAPKRLRRSSPGWATKARRGGPRRRRNPGTYSDRAESARRAPLADRIRPSRRSPPGSAGIRRAS